MAHIMYLLQLQKKNPHYLGPYQTSFYLSHVGSPCKEIQIMPNRYIANKQPGRKNKQKQEKERKGKNQETVSIKSTLQGG